MIYTNCYEYAAVIIVAVVLVLFLTRRLVITRSDRIFLALVCTVLGTSVFDIISSYTISNPESYPLWFNYFVSGGYIFLFPASMYVYMMYVDSMTKISKLDGVITKLGCGLLAFDFLIYVTSYWSHLLIYFDEDLNYRYGVLFVSNYILPTICLIITAFMIFYGRVKYSVIQKAFLMLFWVAVLLGVVIQLFVPELLLGGFVCSIMVLFLFITFENPSYYVYKDTYCQNRQSFYIMMKELRRNGKSPSVVVARIDDADRLERLLSNTQRENLIHIMADTISKNFRRSGFLLGEDSFAVVTRVPNGNLEKEESIVKKINEMFSKEIDLSGRVIRLSVSTAIIPHTDQFNSMDDMASVINILFSETNDSADQDVYKKVETAVAKKQRKDLVKTVVEKAIAEDSFQIYYQPIYNVATKRFESAEALVRLIDKEHGFISPDEFIPITEESGLILPIGEMIFSKVCKFIKAVDRKALGIKYIEVNLSPVQCEKKDISDRLFGIMEEIGVDPSLINFEITETAESDMDEDSAIIGNIIDMNKKGVHFSVDDFGSGFASMDYLFALPISLVKVDKSILWKAMDDEKAMIVLKNTFRMIKELNMDILVEGVETKEMVDILTSFGCNYMQGYYFSKPIPENEYVEFLKKNNQ